MAADREGEPATDADGATPASGEADATAAGDEDETTAASGDAANHAAAQPTTVPPAFEDYATDDLPNATPRGPGKDGVLEARFARTDDGPTRLVRDRAEVPLHHTGTLDHDPLGPTLCVQEPTGGVAQGDRHSVAVEAREGARCVVTTQAATKVHSMHSDYAHVDVDLDVAAGAHVEYVPGATIVNEDARCLQTVGVDLAAGASAILSDVLVPDGLTEHEPFGFDHYHARLDARHRGDLVCADAVDLRPAEREPLDLATVGPFATVGTLYVLAPDAAAGDEPVGEADGHAASLDGSMEDLADRVAERLADVERDVAANDANDSMDAPPDESRAAADDAPPDDSSAPVDDASTDERLRTGASTLPFDAGVGVRVLGTRTEAVERAIDAARDEARRALFGVGVPGGGV